MNSPLTLEVFLDRILSTSFELEWVDLLSQLEFIGARKIAKAVRFDKVSRETLRHLSEEASHAYLLKAACEACGLKARSWTENLFGEMGFRYFQTLDRKLSEIPTVSAYPAVSFVVETRVLEVYPLYYERTELAPVKAALRQILAQERRHKSQFGAIPFSRETLDEMMRFENQLWKEFLGEMHARTHSSDSRGNNEVLGTLPAV